MKPLKCLSVLVATILMLSIVVEARNKTYGYLDPFDRLLATDNVVEEGISFYKNRAVSDYPPKGHISNTTLTAIRVWDWGGYDQFGFAYLHKGGPGYSYCTIVLRSQRGKGLNFTIQYFGV